MENKLIKLWNKYPPSRQIKEENIDLKSLDSMLRQIFCPGPTFFCIFDFSLLDFQYVHPDVEKIIGLPSTEAGLQAQYALIEEKELPFIFACEEYAGKFLHESTPPAQRKNYKVSYTYRTKTTWGDTKLIFHQAVAISTDENHKIAKTLSVNSDVTGLFEDFQQKLSLIGMNGLPSFYDIDLSGKKTNLPNTHVNPLSCRQTEVLGLLAEGLTDKEIGAALFVSDATVRTHRRDIREKLNCKNTTMAVAIAIRNGWI